MDFTDSVIKDICSSIIKLSDRTAQLENKNQQMGVQTISIVEAIKELAKGQETIIEQVQALQYNTQLQEALWINTPYEICDPEKPFRYFRPRFEPHEETIRKVIEEKASLARFGDGEFSLMGNVERHKFQRNDSRLAERLIQTVQSQDPRLLVAIADNYGNLEKYHDSCANGIRWYMTAKTRMLHESILDPDRIYSDAYLTRFYVIYKDNMTDAPAKRLASLRRMWDNRQVITVEGELTRLGAGNDLFDNTASMKRIIAPATSSFDRYDELLASALKHGEKDTLFLLAIGPSSGVLAYDLMINGFQALDIGHLDLEYEWMRAGEGKRVSVPTRYNNEVEGDKKVEPIDDPLYFGQIIDSYT